MTQHQHTQSVFATEANPTLARHHWQLLATLVLSHRPEWDMDVVIEKLWLCRDMQPFPELARIALAVTAKETRPSTAITPNPMSRIRARRRCNWS
jgi:hypothetical protein